MTPFAPFATLPLLMVLAVVGQVSRPSRAASHVLSVCDVLSAPLRYNGQMITVRGRVRGTDEGAWLVSDRCPGVWVTEKHVWPSIIYLAMPTIPAPLRVHEVKFEFDSESQRRADAKYVELRKSTPADCIEFTYTGLFDTRVDWSKAKLTYPNGSWKYAGFGHIGEAPSQLLLRSADGVSALSNCTASGSGDRN